jgi:predicted metalloprotease with PDZ domain
MKGKLLWVYEGMTEYLGNVLAARSGLRTQEQYREALAYYAASLDDRRGRIWRNTEDTAIAASILRADSPGWSDWRRGQDYYFEGELLWLDVDTTIRQLTHNQKNLHDFLLIFFGKGGDTGPMVIPYTFDELTRDLNEVVRYDWSNFLQERVTTLAPHADLAGIERGGYKLVFTDKPTSFEKASLESRHLIDAWYSVGLRMNQGGKISDVRVNSAADQARLFPGEKIMAVDGIVYSNDAFTAALKRAAGSSDPIRLVVQADNYVSNVDVNYHEGEKFPALQRIDGTPALLDDITKPMTAVMPIPAVKKDL